MHLDAALQRLVASMEPLPQGSGNTASGSRFSSPCRASMEPLPQGSGNEYGPMCFDRTEATLQWSHSLRGVETAHLQAQQERTHGLQWSHSLRGVETRRRRSYRAGHRLASMEPLPQGSGNCRSGWIARHVAGFNGATPSGEWKREAARGHERCRYRFNGATPSGEWKRDSPRTCRRAVVASMEPLPQGSGNEKTAASWNERPPASMEPLPQGSGNVLHLVGLRLLGLLQWSHSLRGVETTG